MIGFSSSRFAIGAICSRFNSSRFGAVGDTLPTNSAEAQQFFDRLLTPPTPGGAIETAYAAFIDGLVDDGVWADLDTLHILAAPATPDSEGLAQTNLVQADYQATRVNVSGARATYTPLEGFLSTAIGNHINFQLNPLTSPGIKFQQNDCSMGAFVISNTQINAAVLNTLTGGTTVVGNTQITPKWSTAQAFASINHTAANMAGANADTHGFYIAQRTGSTAQALYRNDALLVSGTQTSIAPPDGTLRALCRQKTAATFAGASLDSTQRTALHARLITFLTDLGVTLL